MLQLNNKPNAFKQNKQTIIKALKELNIVNVYSRFSGSGDSGCLEHFDFELNPLHEKSVEEIQNTELDYTFTYEKVNPARQEGDDSAPFYISVSETKTSSLIESLETFFYSVIDIGYAGWENNDGAEGSIQINTEEENVTLDICVYRMESDSFQEEY